MRSRATLHRHSITKFNNSSYENCNTWYSARSHGILKELMTSQGETTAPHQERAVIPPPLLRHEPCTLERDDALANHNSRLPSGAARAISTLPFLATSPALCATQDLPMTANCHSRPQCQHSAHQDSRQRDPPASKEPRDARETKPCHSSHGTSRSLRINRDKLTR